MTDWSQYAKRVLRGEMIRTGTSYADLVEALAATGVNDTVLNLRNKISRGAFTAAFFCQCLSVMGLKTLHLPEK